MRAFAVARKVLKRRSRHLDLHAYPESQSLLGTSFDLFSPSHLLPCGMGI